MATKEYYRKYHLLHKVKRNLESKLYHTTHKEQYLHYYKINRTKIIKSSSLWAKRNKLRRNLRRRIYHKLHIEQLNQKANTFYKIKRKTNLNYRLAWYLRARVNSALKGNPKVATTMNLIGCTIEQFKQHLEAQFQPGMSWNNYGKWHIDHIRPCASFDLSIPEEQRKCFNFINLQPLWAKDNLSKGTKYDKEDSY